LSPSARPIKPNINRDLFIQRIQSLEGTTEEILYELHQINDKCRKYIGDGKKIKCSPTQIGKCHKSGLYLFLFDEWSMFRSDILNKP
jgi:hypothetical protein